MPLGAQVWNLDWITFDPRPETRDAHGVQWILVEEKGFWGTPGTNATTNPRLNEHGEVRSPGWKKARTITLTGRCYAEDFTTLRRAESKVNSLLSDPTEPGKLVCHSEFGPLACDVYLDDDIICTPLEVVSEPGIEFSVQVIAPDPRKYTVDWSDLQQASLPMESDDGLDFQQNIPPDLFSGLFFGGGVDDGLMFGTSNSTGFISLRNPGTAPTSPMFTINGPLTNPTLTTSTGQMTYNGTLAAGEFVVIDPSAPSVLLGGTSDRRHLLYPANFEAFTVPAADPVTDLPGTLSVGLSHTGSATATGYVTATVRGAWF
jgi:hypothetical protein